MPNGAILSKHSLDAFNKRRKNMIFDPANGIFERFQNTVQEAKHDIFAKAQNLRMLRGGMHVKRILESCHKGLENMVIDPFADVDHGIRNADTDAEPDVFAHAVQLFGFVD